MPTFKRRWLQFSVRSLLLFTLLAGVLLGWVGRVVMRVRHQRAVVTMIEQLGGSASLDYQEARPRPEHPPGPGLLRWLVGDDAFAYVDLVHFELHGSGDPHVKALRDLPRVRSVWLSGVPVSQEIMAEVARVPRLEKFCVFHTNVSPEALAALESAEHLGVLTLVGSAVRDETLAQVERFRRVWYLDLIQTQVGPAGLRQVGRMKSLRGLNVSKSGRVGDEGIAHLRDLEQLETLFLAATPVTDAGLQHLRGLDRLTALSLENTRITDAGLAEVAQLAGLRHLDVRGVQVSDRGVLLLGGLRHLETLLVSTPVTPAGLKRLKESLPECTMQLRDAGGKKVLELP